MYNNGSSVILNRRKYYLNIIYFTCCIFIFLERPSTRSPVTATTTQTHETAAGKVKNGHSG